MTSTFAPATPAPGTGWQPCCAAWTCTGPAGRLEALLNEGAPDAPFAALVCHPHPKGGGTMHNKVVYHAMKALNAPEWGLGWPVLRFNFRGTGLSEGAHDGKAETGDVLAALDWLENEYKRPVVVVGFSFGAAMALLACCSIAARSARNLRALAALGLPTQAEGRHYRYSFLASCSLPKLFLSGDRDQFAPAADLNMWPPPRPNPKSWCSYPAPITFLPASLRRCRTRSPAGSRSNCHDSSERRRP